MGLFSPRCVQCGTKIHKKADFCGECGAANRESYRQCGSCGAAVGAQKSHCWKCGDDLTGQSNPQLFNDRWRRAPEEFAIRFPLRVPDGPVHHGIQIDEGTRAFLMINGKHDEDLEPGYHVLTSFLERLTKLGKLSEQSEAMLVNIGPQMIDFELKNLHDTEQVPLQASLRLDLRLENPERFYERVMLHREVLTSDDLVALIGEEVGEATAKRAAEYRIESLLIDTSQREGLEGMLRPEMERILEPIGLSFAGVRIARFSGPEVERLRDRLGAKAVQIRDWEIDREFKSLERNHRFKDLENEQEYAELEAKLSHEYGLREGERQKLRKLWEQQAERDLRRDQRGGEREDELTELEHKARVAELEGKVTKVKGSTERDEDLADLEIAAKAHEMHAKRKAAKLKQKLEEADAAAARKIKLAQQLQGINSEALIAASEGEKDVIDALVNLAAVQQGGAAGGYRFAPGANVFRGPGIGPGAPHWNVASTVGGTEDQRLQAVAQQAISSVALLSLTSVDGDSAAFGTGWMLGPRVLATNAHVAAEAKQAMEQGLGCWAVFGGKGGGRNAKVEQVVLHPKYGDPGPGPSGRKPAVPAYDVALMVLDADQPSWLELAPVAKLAQLTQGTRVAYLGFPMEDMAGGGVHLERPEPIMKSGIISALGDWWLGSEDPSRQYLIQHDLGVAGGASGSPLLDLDGQVVGIVSAGNMAPGMDVSSGQLKRIPSGVVLNFAQRVDLLGELLEREDPQGM